MRENNWELYATRQDVYGGACVFKDSFSVEYSICKVGGILLPQKQQWVNKGNENTR